MAMSFFDLPALAESIESTTLRAQHVSEEPLTIPSDQIKDIQVLMTLVDGKTVWRNRI
jgi:hypothetical protein